jgi:hypothetical protein
VLNACFVGVPGHDDIGLPFLHRACIDRMDPPEVVVPVTEKDPSLTHVQTQIPRVAVVERLVAVARHSDHGSDTLQVDHDVLGPDVPRMQNEIYALRTKRLENIVKRMPVRVGNQTDDSRGRSRSTHRSV